MTTPPGSTFIYTKEEPKHSWYISDRCGVTIRQDGPPRETKATWLVIPLEDKPDHGHIVHLQMQKQLSLLLQTEGATRKAREVVIRGELTDEEGCRRQTRTFTQDGEWTIKSLFNGTPTIVTRKENPFSENQNVTITSTVGADHHSKWTFVET